MEDPMICPECCGWMKEFWKGVFTRRLYGTCKKCRYTCSADFVSGFWAGVIEGEKNLIPHDPKKPTGERTEFKPPFDMEVTEEKLSHRLLRLLK